MRSDDRYVIWSFEHCAWWGPGRRGYTSSLASAGRYSRYEAESIVSNEESLALEDALVEERTIGPRGGDGDA